MVDIAPSNRQPRALVADDDAAFRMLMEQALAESGFETLCVRDGEDAIKRAVEFEPELIFLDNLMPGLSGLQACAEIRQRMEGRCPPIIMVTSGDATEDITQAFSAGATDYLVKPVNWHLFRHRLTGWLTKAERPTLTTSSRCRGDEKLLVDRSGKILEVMKRRHSDSLIAGASEPCTLADLVGELPAQEIRQRIVRVLKTRGADSVEIALERAGGSQAYQAEVAAKGAARATVILRAVPDAVDTKEELFRLAYVDPITGVPNRHLFDASARDRMERASFKGRSLTFLCIAFDRLVDAQPDQPYVRNLLAAAAKTITENLRDSDHLVRFDLPDASSPPLATQDSVNFLILIDHAEANDVVDKVVARIQAACASIELDDGNRVELVPRVGVSCFPKDGQDLGQLVDAAQLATREARQVRQHVRRFGSNVNACPSVKIDLETELKHAMEAGQLHLYYQPRIDLHDGRVLAAEALIRWQHPFRGLVPVHEILDIAASAGEVANLTDWAVREACAEAKTWTSAPNPVKVSINISKEQIIRPNFADVVIAMLEKLQIDPAVIELEVPEHLLDCTANSVEQFQQLCDVGVGIIVDDFGSDRTSLQTLRRLRIDGFKVNHSHARVASLAGNDSGVYSLAAAIAQARDTVLIAKGIESAEELAFVRSRQCSQAQGFHICQPLPAEDFRQYLNDAVGTTTSLLDLAEAI